MREIDQRYELVKSGNDVAALVPLTVKSNLAKLEKQEKYCSWFQLKGGTMSDQIPAVRIGNRYYTMPLKIQKAIFRHVRLHSNFKNEEMTLLGFPKLWIPLSLMKEKLRTSRRLKTKELPMKKIKFKKEQNVKRIGKKNKTSASDSPSTRLDELHTTGTTSLLGQLKEKMNNFSEEAYIEFECPVEDYLCEIIEIIKYDCKDALNDDLFFKKAFLELQRRT